MHAKAKYGGGGYGMGWQIGLAFILYTRAVHGYYPVSHDQAE
jgi:hypothetical protein